MAPCLSFNKRIVPVGTSTIHVAINENANMKKISRLKNSVYTLFMFNPLFQLIFAFN